ncbi:MAG: signal transduction histidine kinase [Marinoscillum sp.]|jgi:signal transduction histidine kinase
MNVLSVLKEIPDFEKVPDAELQWMIDCSEVVDYNTGDFLFKPGDAIDKLLILLEGQVILKSQQGNQFRVVGTFERLTITGYLPYSRADKAFGFAEVTKPSSVLVLPKSCFREMITQNENLTTALVHNMSSRIRSFTKTQQQNDKMMALGKLSAGLAHELNNPSAAIVRSAQNLSKHLKQVPESFKNVIKINMTDHQVDAVNEILFSKLGAEPSKLTMMERSSLEDELLDWLDENEIDNASEISENLAAMGFDMDDMDKVSSFVQPSDLGAIVGWLNQILVTESLVSEIEDASQRINTLVSSVKSYTHMDQAPEKKKTDIHTGIENTLTMLQHKINKNKILVTKKYDQTIAMPFVLVSEINQVWTNVIDNAIDAMEESQRRELTIRTLQDGNFINVFIADCGSGIPEEAQGKIYDPFFTTKAIGQGTGLGMEVVHQIVSQHNGSITFETKPGFTEFKICLPLNNA